jgi:hypothetical protein
MAGAHSSSFSIIGYLYIEVELPKSCRVELYWTRDIRTQQERSPVGSSLDCGSARPDQRQTASPSPLRALRVYNVSDLLSHDRMLRSTCPSFGQAITYQLTYPSEAHLIGVGSCPLKYKSLKVSCLQLSSSHHSLQSLVI